MDGDAYCVADPAPLFNLLDIAGFAYWSSIPWKRSPLLDSEVLRGKPWQPHVQGGHWVADLSQVWRELLLARWLDNNSAFWYSLMRLGDEDVWTLIWSCLQNNKQMVVDRCWVGPGCVCNWNGIAHIVHRVRAKLYRGTTPRRISKWPHEDEVFRLFHQLDSGYRAKVMSEQIRNTPQARRELRRSQITRTGCCCGQPSFCSWTSGRSASGRFSCTGPAGHGGQSPPPPAAAAVVIVSRK
ncbi:MAG: hypothetical protein ABR915_15440 [Thermoguttaceae bacterium]